MQHWNNIDTVKGGLNDKSLIGMTEINESLAAHLDSVQQVGKILIFVNNVLDIVKFKTSRSDFVSRRVALVTQSIHVIVVRKVQTNTVLILKVRLMK